MPSKISAKAEINGQAPRTPIAAAALPRWRVGKAHVARENVAAVGEIILFYTFHGGKRLST